MANRTKTAALAMVGFATLIVGASGALAAGPSKCSGTKIKSAGKEAASRLTCLSKAVGKAVTQVDSTCIAKAEVKYSTSIAKAELKTYAPPDVGCLTTGDADTIEDRIDLLYADVDDRVVGPDGSIRPCDASKVKAAGKKTLSKLTCHAKAVTKAVIPDSSCLAKADVKFSSTLAKAETKSAGADCTTVGDFSTYASLVDDAVDDITNALDETTTTTTTTSSTATSSTTTSTTTGSTTTTTVCDCCSAGYLEFTSATSMGICGVVTSGVGKTLANLACGGLYMGGSGVTMTLPSSLPDMTPSVTKLGGCSPVMGFSLGGTTAMETGSVRTCTKAGEVNGYPRAGCLLGPPMPLAHDAVPGFSACVVGRFTSDAVGNGTCGGQVNIAADVAWDVFLTGDPLPSTSGLQPCPICDVSLPGDSCPGASPCCHGGVNDDLACTPATSALNASYPTSHDCPPHEMTYLATWNIPMLLTTGTASDTATAPGGPSQTEVFCGFCRSTVSPFPFRNPPQPCTANATCTTTPFRRCEQQSDGAFGNSQAHTITLTGSPSSTCLADGAPHGATLVSSFCIPTTFNGTVDAAYDVPGPGALSLPGSVQLQP